MGLGGIASIGGHSLSLDNNCYYNTTTQPGTSGYPSDLTTITEEMLDPTNVDNTGSGDGSFLSNFTQGAETLARQTEVAMSLFTGGYIVNTIGNITLGCTVNCDEELIDGKFCDIHNGANFVYTAKAPNDIWIAVSLGLQTIISLATLLTIIYIVLGRQWKLSQ